MGAERASGASRANEGQNPKKRSALGNAFIVSVSIGVGEQLTQTAGASVSLHSELFNADPAPTSSCDEQDGKRRGFLPPRAPSAFTKYFRILSDIDVQLGIPHSSI